MEIQIYFLQLYAGYAGYRLKNQGLSITTYTFPLLHLDDKLIIKPRHKFLIFKANINLKYCISLRTYENKEISLQCLTDHGLVHAIYGTLQQVIFSDLGKAIKEACKKLAYLQGIYKIIFYSNPPNFSYPVRPASHDIYITKGYYAFPSIWTSELPQEYEELFHKETNHDNWRIYSEAKEIEGNIKFDPEYHMLYQNKIQRIFLCEHHGSYGTITRGIGRLIKPDFGKDSQLRKEYKELSSWHEIWQPDDIDGTEGAPILEYDDDD